jgi:hypothetical protein
VNEPERKAKQRRIDHEEGFVWEETAKDNISIGRSFFMVEEALKSINIDNVTQCFHYIFFL